MEITEKVKIKLILILVVIIDPQIKYNYLVINHKRTLDSHKEIINF
jgi:hypothetical protein